MHVRHALGFAAAFAAAFAVAATALPAQQAQRYVPVFGATASMAALEPGVAASNQVGDRPWGLQFDGGVLVKRHLYFGADLGGLFLKDHAQFTQNTTGGEKTSTANVTYLSATTGLRSGSPRFLPVSLALNVGYSVTMSRRSIDQCTNCDVDKLDIPGGGFVEPMLVIGRQRARLRVSGRSYFAGDGMQNVVALGLDYTAWKR